MKEDTHPTVHLGQPPGWDMCAHMVELYRAWYSYHITLNCLYCYDHSSFLLLP